MRQVDRAPADLRLITQRSSLQHDVTVLDALWTSLWQLCSSLCTLGSIASKQNVHQNVIQNESYES